MIPQLTVHRAQAADIPQIAAIEREAFPDPWDERSLREALALYPDTFLVAKEDGRIVGFVAGGLQDTGEERYGHIMNLAVLPECRRRGIGGLLVSRVERLFAYAGAAGVQLEVRITNHAAQQFYRRLGYREVFQIHGYYADNEEALVMMKWFRF
ncbi:MAG: ribosomal protein S18-alanine N-acetyltransferase [Methanomicrobiaceae archaeon]|nr:ribosomal protein S18-alanine N-acetyltransferase [Methanomicrobiaceae archaeon]MDD5418238.1 ribosomal protein S18-alanine N-acetyltransferase [Methanomicrobiaceae archaeon]